MPESKAATAAGVEAEADAASQMPRPEAAKKHEASNMDKENKDSPAHATDHVPEHGLRVALPTSSAFEDYIVYPILFVTVFYHIIHFIPSTLLPATFRHAWWGYPSDLFLLSQAPTSVPTLVLRESLKPNGLLGQSTWIAQWRNTFGNDILEQLITRLSSVEGRVRMVPRCLQSHACQKLYLVLGTEPFLACAFCHTVQDFQMYKIYGLWRMYIAHAFVLSIATISPHGTLPRVMEHMSRRAQQKRVLSAVRTRVHWRMWAWIVLVLAFVLDVAAILYAEDLPLPSGRWEHVRLRDTSSHTRY